MAEMTAGSRLDALTGLGNGFDGSAAHGHTLLIGGGIGIAPLYWLAGSLRERGIRTTAVLGFNTAEDVFCENEFASLCDDVVLATADGSRGVSGFVTDAVAALEYDYFYTCGPVAMMKAVCRMLEGPGEASLEERMGCGAGFCYCCTCETVSGPKRVCTDGPVFKKEELPW